MSQITVTGLTFGYDGSYTNVFEDVSFNLDTDWRLGFIGRNGRGKTTLLKLLMGEYEFSGKINSSVEFDYFPYEVADKSRDTLDVIAENCPQCEEWEIYRELALMELDSDCLLRPFETLSNGERTRALLAAMFLRPNRFLLIDEPTNHLDMQARDSLAAYLKQKKGFILVSHDRAFLDGVIDHVLSINRADIEVQQGNYSSWETNKEQRDSYELGENRRLSKEIDRLTDAARRASGWSDKVEKTKYATRDSGLRPDRGFIGAKSAKMMKRAKSNESRSLKAAEEKKGLLKNVEQTERIKLHPLEFPQRIIMSTTGLSLSYENRTVCENVRFELQRGDRLAIQGGNGSGKTSLLRLLSGEDISHEGELHRAGKPIISVVPQDASGISGSVSEYAERLGLDLGLFLSALRKLALPREQFDKDIADFSEGQKKKVLLAGSLVTEAHVYIWDEPLNYIDVISRRQIEELILRHEPTMVFVEHDRAFVEAVATKRIVL